MFKFVDCPSAGSEIDVAMFGGFSEATEGAVSSDSVSNPGGGDGEDDAEGGFCSKLSDMSGAFC